MRAAASVSPFAAKTSQEQKEQWIWWQCQKDATVPVVENPAAMEERPAVNRLPERETQQRELPEAANRPSTNPPVMMQPHHRQYDAIMKRMKAAQGRVGTFTDCK